MGKKLKSFFIIFFSIVLITVSVFILYGTYYFFFHSIYPKPYEDIVNRASEKYGVKKELIYSTICTESQFDEKVISSAGAIGLMQITPDTFKWLQTKKKLDFDKQDTIKNLLFNPEINIDYGTFFISILLDKYEDKEVAMCAYNAGMNAVDRWLEDKELSKDGKTLIEIPYGQTKNYAKKILMLENTYEELYSDNCILKNFFDSIFPQ